MSELTPEGLGDRNAGFRVYIGNRPATTPFEQIDTLIPLNKGQVKLISDANGNGWRKVFNVYAKLLFACQFGEINRRFDSWQSFRDEALLQAGSDTSLLFSPPDLSDTKAVHLVMGKHYALSLNIQQGLTWLDDSFAVNPSHHLVVCPYFDYRQLSNAKIIRLTTLLEDIGRV